MWKNGGAANSSSTTTLLVTLGVVILSVVVGAAANRRRKNNDKKKKRNGNNNTTPTTTPSLPARNDASSVGNDNAMFCASANSIKNLSARQLANAEKLQLYSLYKQATVGNAPKWFTPSSYDLLTEQAKHHAWSQLRGMAQPEATQAYIKVAQSLLLQVAAQNNGRTHPAEGDDDSDDDDESIDHDALSDDEVDYSKPQPVVSNNKTTSNTNPTEPDGFGVGVSRPIEQEETEEESDGEDTKPPHVALLQAASKNDIATIQRLVNATVPGTVERSHLVDHTDDMGQTALHLAADAGHDNAVRCLISAGANVTAADQDGISVLQAAVIAGKVETSRILWQEGHADPDQADHDGDTPRQCSQDDGSSAMKRLFENIPVAIKEDAAVLNVSAYSANSADTIDEEEEEDGDETQDTEAETITPTPEQQQRKQQQTRGRKDATDKRLIAV